MKANQLKEICELVKANPELKDPISTRGKAKIAASVMIGHLDPTEAQLETLAGFCLKCYKQTGQFNVFRHKDDFGHESHFELDKDSLDPFVFWVYIHNAKPVGSRPAYRFKLAGDGSIQWAPGIIGFIRDQQI